MPAHAIGLTLGERLARWLTLEQPALRAVVPEAVELVEAVTRAPFWAKARARSEVHAEVPFAVRVEAGTSIPGVAVVERPAVLRGVIDLVYRAADGWRILDYKTDRLEGAEDRLAGRRRGRTASSRSTRSAGRRRGGRRATSWRRRARLPRRPRVRSS
ncbi:MAG TPA: PD-(D/E)XK nuclease family protein [Vicinamibacterales bacterium]|nr:PD-(D/E)XK nuclease family protein [Vicinamibacterales bacterium]HOQ60011.1 PD-(D/E)XK nuclease family protein [Vicinamibacterales bacterium]HPK71704.1 PD-(D/E)XK nuclease family protein [Vicinamibacterales bacterium]